MVVVTGYSIAITIVSIAAIILAAVAVLMEEKGWVDLIPSTILKKIWGYNKTLRGEVYKNPARLIKIKIYKDKFLLSLYRVIVTSVSAYVAIIFAVIVGVLLILYGGIVRFTLILAGVIISPFYIIRKLAECNHLLKVAISVAIGGVVGTLSVSYTLGIGVGVATLLLSSVMKKVFKEINLKHFFYYKNEWAGYATGHHFLDY